MKLEPTEEDQRINPVFIIAYSAFLLIPCFALYKAIQNHSLIGSIAASIAILGFAFLLILTIRHNKKVKQKDGL